MSTQVGLCWPLNPGGGAQTLDPVWLDRIQEEAGISLIRVDCDHRNPQAGTIATQAQHAGMALLPILRGDEAAMMAETVPGQSGPALHALLVWAIEFVKAWKFPLIEVLNEPYTMHGMAAETYAQIVNAVGQEMRTHAPATAVVIACECMKADKRGPEPHDWFDRVVPGLDPALWDVGAQHPYRNPGAPDVVWRPFVDRQDEFDYVQARTKGKPVITTEVGWEIGQGTPPVDEQRQADYLVRELDIHHDLEIPLCFIYNHVESALDFGLFRADGTPRRAAHAVREWIGS